MCVLPCLAMYILSNTITYHFDDLIHCVGFRKARSDLYLNKQHVGLAGMGICVGTTCSIGCCTYINSRLLQ